MDFDYYYLKDDHQFGPVKLHELIKDVDFETLVWRDGIDWSKASEIEELKIFFHEIVKEIYVEKPIEVIKEVFVEKPVEVIKEVVVENEISNSDSQKTKKSLLIFIILLLLAALAYFLFLQSKENSNNSIQLNTDVSEPIDAKIYANIKKRNKIIIGFLSVDYLDLNAQNCLNQLFGNKLVKFSKQTDKSSIYNDFKAESIDLILISENEKILFDSILDISSSFKIEGKTGVFYLGFPKNNETHLNNFNNCINNF